MNKRQPITALYERLSRDDELQGQSNSILTQKSMLEDYAAKNGFTNPVHYTDDGFSGGNFDRPGWKALMDEVDAGNVEIIIVKDMSRMGRDYLRVGLYMESFRERNIRLIAISDNVDTLHGEDEFLPFRNILNTWYLRDCSKKIKATMRAKGMEGKPLKSIPVYGYVKSPEDKNKWLVDPEAAEVVRRIFRLSIEGNGPQTIARILTNDKIMRPSNYMVEHGIVNNLTVYDPAEPYRWVASTVAAMISREEYMGHTVNFKFYKDSYKDTKTKKAPKDDWVIFKNTHEAIVDEETWATAQRCRRTIKRTDTYEEANPFTGLVYCADCGARLYNHRTAHPTHMQVKNGKAYKSGAHDHYACSTNNNSIKKFDKQCSMHFIRTCVLRELTLEAIRSACGFAKENKAAFVQKVREASLIQQTEAAKAHKKRIVREEKRLTELNTLIKKVFEEHALGKISDMRFEMLSADYEQEWTELKESISHLQEELNSFTADSERADHFIALAGKYTDFTELTTPMINEFVDKIVVHEADKSSGERLQQVDIYLNFIGKFDVPITAPELTPEEIAAEEEVRRKREKRREYNKRYNAKRKEKYQRECAEKAQETA